MSPPLRVLLVALLLRGAHAVCPLAIGYTLLPGKGLPPGAQVAAATAHVGPSEANSSRAGSGSNSWVAAAAKLCSQSTACVAFTTRGTLVIRLPENATWTDLGLGASPCNGVYLRSAVLGGWREEMTGVEVSHDFDLPLTYYPRVPLAECVRLCEATPGCRSVSFHSALTLCSLKSATCAEAGFHGGGCRRRDTPAEHFIHKDRATTREVSGGVWQDATFFFATSSVAVTASEARTLCQQHGGQLSSLHRDPALLTVQRLLQSLVAPFANANGFGSARSTTAMRFWTIGRHLLGRNVSAEGSVYWDDGSQYRLGARNITLGRPGGCLALNVGPPERSSRMALTFVDCAEQAFPLCTHYPAGTVVSRVQVDSQMAVRYDDLLTFEDNYLFCQAKGAAEGFRMYGMRGTELATSAANSMAQSYAWSGGYLDSSGPYVWREGGFVTSEVLLPATAGDPRQGCIILRGSASFANRYLLGTATCNTLNYAMCYWPPQSADYTLLSPLPREVARVRLLDNAALLFLATGATYRAAQEECKRLGATLASVPNGDVNDLIISTWLEIEPATSTSLAPGQRRVLTYLGGDTRSGLGFRWLDGLPVNYTGPQFGVIQTSTSGCLQVTTSQSVLPGPTWQLAPDSECDSTAYNFTCRAPAKAFIQPSAMLAFRSSVFELHLNLPRTFDDARDTCRARGGDLASLSADRDFEVIKRFLFRLRHEMGDPTPVTSDNWDYWLGATTNKTDELLYLKDFFWTDGQDFDFPIPLWTWPNATLEYQQIPAGTRTAATLSAGWGSPGLSRRRAHHNFPFLCETPIGEPLTTQQASDGTMYDVLATPYALPYHAAEQVCQVRGGHLAGASTAEQLSIIYQLCSAALRSLPGPSRGGFTSHDLPAACWVGLFCPAGWATDGRLQEGFGAGAWQRLAALQPDRWLGRNTSSILPGSGSTCSSMEDLVWLGGRGVAGGADIAVAGSIQEAAGGLSNSARCAAAFPSGGASGSSTSGQLGMAECGGFAAFVCERPARTGSGAKNSSSPLNTASATTAAAITTDTVIVRVSSDSVDFPPERLPGTARYMGCYAPTARLVRGSGSGGIVSSHVPLPVLLSAAVGSYEACYSLATASGMSHFALSSDVECWGGWEPPTTPFIKVTDDAPCRAACTDEASSPASASAPPGPRCMTTGYSAVFSLGNGAAQDQAPPTPPTPYVCMSEQLLAAPNATLVGQLHVSRAQLPACEALCSRLPACDMYVYDTRSLACILLGLPYAARLADMPLRDALWAADTCVKAARIVDSAVLRDLPIADPAAVFNTSATDTAYLCSPQLSSMSYTAVPAWSPSHGSLVRDADTCSRSCYLNASCHGFVVRQLALPEGGVQYTCTTHGFIAKVRTDTWMPRRPWVWLPGLTSPSAADSNNGTTEGCLMLERLAPPPPYVCSDHVDVGGWELQQLDGMDEQGCRAACDRDEQCSAYVVQEVPGSPPSCSLRFRAFYNMTATLAAVRGTNNRPTACNAVSSVRSCLHTYRLLVTDASTVAGRDTRHVRLGVDHAWHMCVPHMDLMGVDTLGVPSSHENDCSTACSRVASCTYITLTGDSPREGYCHAKYDPMVFHLLTSEFFAMGGYTRIDVRGVADTCLNMDRLLPRAPPELVCGTRYGLALPLLARIAPSNDVADPAANTTGTPVVITKRSGPFACEALCLANASCAGYTWTAHNSTCTLAAVPGQGSTSSGLSLAAAGPNALVSQSCMHVPRLMAAARALLPSQAAGRGGGSNGGAGAVQNPAVHVQAYGEWHYCVSGPGLGLLAWAGPDLLAALSMPRLAGEPANSPACVRTCSRMCTMRQGCQAFSVVQRDRSASDEPVCFLLRWAATAAYATWTGAAPVRRYGVGSSQTCVSLSPGKAMPAGPGGAMHVDARPAAVQAYGAKQYRLHMAPLPYDDAAAHCQGVGGQLASFGNKSELDVVAGLLLRQFAQVQLQPDTDLPLQPAAFWTGLVYSVTTSRAADGCKGWCFSHGRPTNSSLVQPLVSPAASGGGSMRCGATSYRQGARGSRVVEFLAGSCDTWQLPLICEVILPQSAVNSEGAGPSAPVQLFYGARGYADAQTQATAAGARLALLDLTTAVPPARNRHRELVSTIAVFKDVSSAAAACGADQLRSTGCWMRIFSPADACNTTSGATSPLCGAQAALLIDSRADAASSAASLAQQLLDAPDTSLGPAGARCALVLYDTAMLSYATSAALCTTPGAFLASVINPEAPVLAAAMELNPVPVPVESSPVESSPVPAHLPSDPLEGPLPPSTPTPRQQGDEAGLSGGAIAGIAVGSVVGTFLLVAAVAIVARLHRRNGAPNALGSNKHVSMGDLEKAAEASDLPAPGAKAQPRSVPTNHGGSGARRAGAAALCELGGSSDSASALSTEEVKLVVEPEALVSGTSSVPSHTHHPVAAGSSNRSGAFSPLPGSLQQTTAGGANRPTLALGSAPASTHTPALASHQATVTAVASALAIRARQLGNDSITVSSVSSTMNVGTGSASSEATTSTPTGTLLGGTQPSPGSTGSHGTGQQGGQRSVPSQEGAQAGRPAGQSVLQQLLVTARDPDQSGVTWRIDPGRDVAWDTNAVLGKGTFGIVYRGTYKGQPVAIKTVNQSSPSDPDVDAVRALLHEARILAKVRHPNVVTCYGGCITEDSVFIIEELMATSLSQLMKQNSEPLALPLVLRIGMDIAKGLFQLHPTVVHRDLKPSNVLLDETGTAKISDFGLARFKMHSYLLSTNHLAAGTLPFMAPEVFDQKLSGISEKADIYSLAMILVCMLTNQAHPWKDYHYAAIAFKVSAGDRPELPADPARCPPRMVGLLRRMWSQDPGRRPGAADVLKGLGIVLHDGMAEVGAEVEACGAA